MAFLKHLFAVLIFAAIGSYLLPWWSVALVGFVVAYFIGKNGVSSFFAGFVGVFLVWGGYAFWLDAQNHSLLSSKIIQLFHLPNSLAIILLSALVGALVAGFASLSGFLIKKLL